MNFNLAPRDRGIKELLKYGIIVIDKPVGFNPHKLPEYIKHYLNLGKVGHAGTLDPNVSGVMIIGLSSATRTLDYFTAKHKTYIGTLYFQNEYTRDQIENIFSKYRGEITQMPPLRSAVRRVLRKRTVHSFEITKHSGKEVEFKLVCQSGTYVRSIVYDMCNEYGIVVMKSLRRIAVGNITLDNACQLEDVKRAHLMHNDGDESLLRKIVYPVEDMIGLPFIKVEDDCVKSLCCGGRLNPFNVVGVDPNVKKGELVSIVSRTGLLIMIGVSSHDANDLKNILIGDVISETKAVIMKLN